MKLFSQIVLMAALAVPAFCQKPSPFRDSQPSPDVTPALAAQKADLDGQKADLKDQAAELQYQAAKMTMDAKTLAAEKALSDDQVEALSAQAAVIAGQIDSGRLAEMSAKAAAMADQFSMNTNLDLKLSMSPDELNDMKAAAIEMADEAKMAFLQAPAPPAPPAAPRGAKVITTSPFRGRGNDYNAGQRAIDAHKYDEAVQDFDSAIQQDSSRADGALYWKAWALNREGKRDEALAAIAQLRRDYASSGWLHDAQALEAEVKQGNGQPVSPAQESNDDLKLLAINGLMNADPERALPQVENILKGSSGPSVKDRALFVISQNRSPRAQQALLDYAKGGGNPDLQVSAIRYVGMSGTKDAQQQLLAIYTSSSDARVKATVIEALMQAHASDSLLNIAKTEKDANLRGVAVRDLINSRGMSLDGLVELYNAADAGSKHEIVNGLMGRGDGKTLVDLARKETDPSMKRYIVERLSNMRDNKDAIDYMMELLK